MNPREMLASAGYIDHAPKSRHSPEVLRALDNTHCIYCGQPVGIDARGSSQCIPCIRRQIDLDSQGLDPDQVDRILWTDGRTRQ